MAVSMNHNIIMITGMHRSGTSCITGLLNRCGLSAGDPMEMLNNNQSRKDNIKGHFENYIVFTINEKILEESQGTWFNPPSKIKISNNTQDLMIQFNNTFKGQLIKDPRFCLTLDKWKFFCPRIKAIVVCLRHPFGVAKSLKKRNDISIEKGLDLWYKYNIRLIKLLKGSFFIVIDYDRLLKHLDKDLYRILRCFKLSISRKEMVKNIEGFFEKELNHQQFSKDLNLLPGHIRKLYNHLKMLRRFNFFKKIKII